MCSTIFSTGAERSQTDTFLDRQNAGIRALGISNLLRRLQEGFVTALI
jgi:hypothetical protein